MKNPFDVVKDFEDALSEYTGAPYVVTVDSCTNAIFLACKFENISGHTVTIPKRTYLSVPQSIMHAGGVVRFDDREWSGAYQLVGTKVWDSAKRFTSNMYIPGSLMCLSFHSRKILNIGKGGAILTDDKGAAEWFKRVRYEGRQAGLDYRKDDITHLGWNMYMTPEQASRGMIILQNMSKFNHDQIENPPYRDLTEFTLFKDCK